MATQKDGTLSLPFLLPATHASTFPPSFANCGVRILSQELDQELVAYLQDHSSSSIDSFYYLVELFKHLQEHPLLSEYLHAQGKSTTHGGDGDGKQAGEKEKKDSPSTDPSTMTCHATSTICKRFPSRHLLKNFIRGPLVHALILLYLQQKRLAVQQLRVVGSSSTFIQESHAAAFASLCKFLGMKLMPGLDDIHVIAGEENDAQEDEEEMEEEGGEENWVASSHEKNDNQKHKTNEPMVVADKVDEEARAVAMEIDGKGKEEGEKVRGTIAAPNTIVVKKRKCISLMPTGLKGVWILTPMLQQHLIQEFWQDETKSTTTRAFYVYRIASLFRFFQEDASICALLASRGNATTAAAAASNQVDQQQQLAISTLPELREFLLQPPVKAKLLDFVRKSHNLIAFKLVLQSLGLMMTASYDDVVSIEANCVNHVPNLRRSRGPSLSHAPSLSAEMQQFIIKIFESDRSRAKSTNIDYLTATNALWRLLETELAGDVAVSSSSGFPLSPPLATPEELCDAFLKDAALKTCFFSISKKNRKVKAAQTVLLSALGLEACQGGNGMLDIVKKKTEEGHPTLEEEEDQEPPQGLSSGGGGGAAGSTTGVVATCEAAGATTKLVADRGELTVAEDEPMATKRLVEVEDDQGPAKAERTDTGDDDADLTATAVVATIRSQVGVGIAGEARLQHRRRETRHGPHILPAPLQSLHRILVDYKSSTTYQNRQLGLVQEGFRLIYEQDQHVMRFASELLVGAPPLLELRGDPYKRRDLACWYLQLILEGVFNVLAATDSVQEG